MSCGAACARQLLRDAGIEVAESVIRGYADFDPHYPIWAPDLVKAMNRLHTGATYQALSLDPGDLDAVLARGPFIALLKVGRGRHWVIVDRIAGSLVHVRDPAGTPEDDAVGAEAVMGIETFSERWTLAINYVVYRRAG